MERHAIRVSTMATKLGTIATDRIREAAAEARRSTLYRWMLKNHDEFQAALKEAGRPNWKALAHAFGEEGLTDLRGRPPTPEGTRQTWIKVSKALKVEEAKGRKDQLEIGWRSRQWSGKWRPASSQDSQPEYHQRLRTRLTSKGRNSAS